MAGLEAGLVVVVDRDLVTGLVVVVSRDLVTGLVVVVGRDLVTRVVVVVSLDEDLVSVIVGVAALKVIVVLSRIVLDCIQCKFEEQNLRAYGHIFNVLD